MLKDLCVYLDGSEADDERLEAARQLAVANDAAISGLYINQMPEIVISDAYGTSGVAIDEIQAAARAEGAKVAEKLKAKLDKLDVRHELRHYDVPISRWRFVAEAEARLFDLFVASLPSRAEDSSELIETVLFGGGRALLLLPEGGARNMPPKTVLLGWKNSRESARAVSQAIPFMNSADMVSVCMINEGHVSSIDSATQGKDIARHLDRHGVKVDLNPVSEGRGVGQTLMDEAKLINADLIVMGGYGHTRFREWLLGGATRDVLMNMDRPVLIAH